MQRRVWLLLAILLGQLVITRPLLAADPPPNPPSVNGLIQTLEDPVERDKLLAQLKALQNNDPAAHPAPAPGPLALTTADFDRSSMRLMQKLTGTARPWMWWAAGLIWGVAVLATGALIRRGINRLFPTSRASWLGRGFAILSYLVCALIAFYFVLHAVGASLWASPLLRIEQKLVLFALAVGIADLALLLVNLAIDRYLNGIDPAGQPIERSPRILTLLPLLRNVAMVALGAVLALVVLDDFGINIAPLLAGAGVVGVALGFGSQKLVQDVITGAFILFENTIAVGDFIKIGEHSGTVESMTLRTLRLRDVHGLIHTLPFSAVPNVINMSRDFGFYPFEINVTYDSDIDKALAAISAVVGDMETDPAIRSEILAPVEIWGVERLGEWSVVLSGRIKTPPGRQAILGRAFNRRVKARFDQDGVKFATRSF